MGGAALDIAVGVLAAAVLRRVGAVVAPVQPVRQLETPVGEVRFQLAGVALVGHAVRDGHVGRGVPGVPARRLPAAGVFQEQGDGRLESPIVRLVPGGGTAAAIRPLVQRTAHGRVVNVRVEVGLLLAAGAPLLRIVVLPVPIEAGGEHAVNVGGGVGGEAELFAGG